MKSKNKKDKSILDWIEIIGNKIPHPFILFFLLTIGVIIISAISSYSNISVIDPIKGGVVTVKNLLSGDGINFILKNMIRNFTGFAPLGLVLVMTLGIGLAEEVGLVSAFMKSSILNTSPKLITFMVMLIGICGNIASDAAIVIVPVIAAFVFLSTGRHPIAGIAIGYAATTAGFSANLIVSGTDALLAGISTEAIKIVNPNISVSVVSNWYFMAVSTIFLAFVGTFVCEKIVEPRLGKYKGNKFVGNENISTLEKKALYKSGVFTLIYIIFIIILAFPKNSFFRNIETGSFMNSPLLDGIIPLILILFLISGITYGKVIGKIKKAGDIPNYMSKSIKNMSSYIVLVFIIGQFISYFNWSNLGFVLAVKGADLLKVMNLKGIPLFLMFILLSAFINIFIGSGSAKWALLAPIFIPMFYMLGYSPDLTQVLYRIGDSTTNVISPLFPYMPIILGLFQEYNDESGVGTVISTMLPYTIAFLIMWSFLAIIWVYLGIPLGPGAKLFL